MKKRNIILAIGLALLGAIGMGSSANAWGPERPTYTWEKPAESATFNSITNNPSIGDERNFVRIREAGTGNFVDEVSLKVGKEYEVYIYYHNNAKASIGLTEAGVSLGTSIKSSFPATVTPGTRGTIVSTIMSDNAQPRQVWDEAYVTTTSPVFLRYVPGTIVIHNGGNINGQNINPEYLFSSAGALIGFNNFGGGVPGCNEFAGYIIYRFKVDQPNFSIEKKASLDGVNWSESVKAAPGREVWFKVRYTNTGTMDQDGVHLRDALPTGMTYIPGTSMLYNPNFPSGKAVPDEIMTTGGINIGNYSFGSGSWGEIRFMAKVDGRDMFSCGTTSLRNVGTGKTGDGEKSDDAWVEVEVECEPEECRPGIPTGDPRCDETPPPDCDPEVDDDCKEPVVPGELPKTGPAEVVLAAVVIAAIGVAATYWIRSRKLVKNTQDAIEGNGPDGAEKSEKSDKTAKSDKIEENKDSDKGAGLES